MKSKIIILGVLVAILSVLFLRNNSDSISDKRKVHEEFLANSPFKDALNLTKKERKALGIPPNKYYEREWELTMNPELGRPTPENIFIIQEELRLERQNLLALGRVPGDESGNEWEERGPNNFGGRTKGLMFDPNDDTNETVFAGGVSGGLWKNTNISNVNSPWVLVDIPSNLSVTSLKVDPNDSNIFYIGTGESYTAGDADGNGVWKSRDAGTSWEHVFGGISGNTTFESDAEVVINSPASIAGSFTAVQAAFGPELVTFSGNLVIADDGSSAPTEACNALTSANAAAVNGNIAVIERANCNFTDKVINAQDAGAVGVIMINNVVGPPIVQGGDDAAVTIPSVMISKEDGALVLAELNAFNVVNVTINPIDSAIAGAFLVSGQTHINDITIRDNDGTSEIFVAVGDSFYADSSNATYMGGPDLGLYKSIDAGATWNKLTIPTTNLGNPSCPNDLEIAADNTIYLSTTYSYTYQDGGGMIYKSTDGTNFIFTGRVNNGRRTEIAVSSTDPGIIFVLAQIDSDTNPVTIKRTSNGFATLPTTLGLPNDADGGISSEDFTRGQSFYDLTIEVDPLNDNNVFVGGIDLFKSGNSGSSWAQISHWTGNYGYQYVHADQHGVSFSGDGEVIFGTDGGVFYSEDNGVTIFERNLNYNVTQFYKMGVGPTTAFAGEIFIAGAQDNGSLLIENATPGVNSATKVQSGDGAYCFFDQDGSDKYHISNYVYNATILLHDYVNGSNRTINDEDLSNGDFINQQALDSNLNLLYSNYSNASGASIRRYSSLLSGTVGKTIMTNELLTNTPSSLEVSPYTTSGSTLLVGTDSSELLKITNANDGSASWLNISGDDFFGSVSDIQFGQSEDEIFVTMHNYGVNNIFYTIDGGSSWIQKDGNLPDMPVKCILQNPLNLEQVIIGTDLGVWWTQDFSSSAPSWHQAYNGMRDVKVTDLQMRDDYKVYAATYGRGVFSGMFTSDDGTVGIDDLSRSSLKLYPNPATSSINLQLLEDVEYMNYQIIDSNGKLIYSSSDIDNSSSLMNINISNLDIGVYFIRLNSKDNVYINKFIKK